MKSCLKENNGIFVTLGTDAGIGLGGSAADWGVAGVVEGLGGLGADWGITGVVKGLGGSETDFGVELLEAATVPSFAGSTLFTTLFTTFTTLL